MEKCVLKNSFYKKTHNAFVLILQRDIQVLNFIHLEQCQADLAADTVSCLWLLVCVPMLLHLLSLLGNQTAFMLSLLGFFFFSHISFTA